MKTPAENQVTYVQWTGENLDECKRFLEGAYVRQIGWHKKRDDILFMSGGQQAIVKKGEYIVKNLQVNFHTCSHCLFK